MYVCGLPGKTYLCCSEAWEAGIRGVRFSTATREGQGVRREGGRDGAGQEGRTHHERPVAEKFELCSEGNQELLKGFNMDQHFEFRKEEVEKGVQRFL